MRYLIVPLMLAMFSSCKAQNEPVIKTTTDKNSLLWKISGNGLKEPSYLYGTFHMLCREDIRFTDNLKLALNRADEVYFEMDLDDPATLLGGIFFMNMKGDSTLKDFYTEQEYNRLYSFFKDSLRLPIQTLSRMKPALLEAFMYPSMLNCKNTSGVEEQLMLLAKAGKKPISGLETIQEQSAVFDSIPYSVQAKSLYKSIDSLAQYKVQFAQMKDDYLAEKLDAINAEMENDNYSEGDFNYFLLEKRNKNWIVKLKKVMAEKKLFIAVGAGHLGGEMGMIALLEKEGYKVEPVSRK